MELIPMHEKWRREYRLRRYLEHATKDQLSQRVRDITCNTTFLDGNGKISFRAPNEGGAFWGEKFTHTSEEHDLRGEDFQPNLMANALLPKPTYPVRPRSAEIISGHQLNPGNFLVKYGKQKYLSSGSIRISPASSWLESNNPAIHDDELRKTFFTHPDEIVIRVHKSRNLPQGHRIEPTGNTTLTHTSGSDYYALCLSCVYDHRLFDDFDADCCLIIHNPRLFAGRLEAAARSLLPTWLMSSRSIDYYDPFDTNFGQVNVHWAKDFRFWYQFEYRFVWHSASLTKGLKPVDLDVGPISDFGELICLV